MDDWPHSVTLRIEFVEKEHADIVRQATSVEPELKPTLVSRNSTIQDSSLLTEFKAKELRSLRVSLGSYLELVQVSIQAIEELDHE